MSIAQTLLVFVGIPVAVALIVTGLVFSGGRRHNRRYRPGRPYDFAPVWYLSAPEHVTAPGPAMIEQGGSHIRTRTDGAPDLWPGEGPHGQTGGASDRW